MEGGRLHLHPSPEVDLPPSIFQKENKMPSRREFVGGSAALAVAMPLTGCARHDMADYQAAAAKLRADLSENPDLQQMIRYATLAPNGHNSQPWRFSVNGGFASIIPDLSRRTPVVDPDDHHLFVSLGCAAENLLLAGAAHGRPDLVIRFGHVPALPMSLRRDVTDILIPWEISR